MSTSDKYPDESNCQQTFKNTRKIEFYVNGNKDQQAGKKLYVQTLFICMESGQDVLARASVTFGPEDTKQKQASMEDEKLNMEIM